MYILLTYSLVQDKSFADSNYTSFTNYHRSSVELPNLWYSDLLKLRLRSNQKVSELSERQNVRKKVANDSWVVNFQIGFVISHEQKNND